MVALFLRHRTGGNKPQRHVGQKGQRQQHGKRLIWSDLKRSVVTNHFSQIGSMDLAGDIIQQFLCRHLSESLPTHHIQRSRTWSQDHIHQTKNVNDKDRTTLGALNHLPNQNQILQPTSTILPRALELVPSSLSSSSEASSVDASECVNPMLTLSNTLTFTSADRSENNGASFTFSTSKVSQINFEHLPWAAVFLLLVVVIRIVLLWRFNSSNMYNERTRLVAKASNTFGEPKPGTLQNDDESENSVETPFASATTMAFNDAASDNGFWNGTVDHSPEKNSFRTRLAQFWVPIKDQIHQYYRKYMRPSDCTCTDLIVASPRSLVVARPHTLGRFIDTKMFGLRQSVEPRYSPVVFDSHKIEELLHVLGDHHDHEHYVQLEQRRSSAAPFSMAASHIMAHHQFFPAMVASTSS